MTDSTSSACPQREERVFRRRRSQRRGVFQPHPIAACNAPAHAVGSFARDESLALVVSTSPVLSEQLSSLAQAASLKPFRTQSFEESRGLLDHDAVEFILVDFGLPEDGAIRLCRLQADRNGPPLVVVGDKVDQIDRIVALEVGADDLFALPMHERESVARMRALMRRSTAKREPGKPGKIIAYAARREVQGPGGSARLSAGTWRLLLLLTKARDNMITVQDLGADKVLLEDGNVRSAVSRLRRKLMEVGESDPIVSYRPGGYGLNCRVEVRK